MKKTLAVLLALVLLIACVSVPVSATETSVDLLDAEIHCPAGYTKHDMRSNGVARVLSGWTDFSPVVFQGFAWKCWHCGELLGTEGSPLQSGIIGRYAFGDAVASNVMVCFYGGVDGSSYVNWRQDSWFGQACTFNYLS